MNFNEHDIFVYILLPKNYSRLTPAGLLKAISQRNNFYNEK